jgi:hypothetical protein
MPTRIEDSVVEHFAVVAKPSELPAALRRRYDGLLGRVSLYFPIPTGDPDARWQGFVLDFRAAC